MKLPSNIWFQIVALLVLAFLAHSAWLYVERHRLESAQAAIRARGEPVTFDELNTPFAKSASDSQPAAEDACRYYRAAAALVRPFPMRSNPFEHLTGATSAPAPAEIAWVRKAVDDNREAFSLMDEGARHGPCRGQARRPWEGTWVDSLVRLASLRVSLRAFDGDGDAAADALTGGLRVAGDSWDKFGPLWSAYELDSFNHDVRVLLERSRPSGISLERLGVALAGLGEPHATVIHAAESMQVWAGSLEEPPESRCSLLAQALEPAYVHRAVGELGGAAKVVAAVKRSWPLDRGTFEGLDDGRGWDVLNYGRVVVNLLRRMTQTRCTLVALALAQYRIDHGAPPATLADLPAKGGREDPLTGKPLLYHAEGNRVTVYSVGTDFRDDGGALIGRFGDYDSADWGVSVTLR